MGKVEENRLKRIIEFLNEPNLDKFNACKKVYFKDGSKMNGWFNMNKNYLFKRNDDYSKELKEQYKVYLDRKFYEFEQIDDIDKFNYEAEYKFSDGVDCYVWFRRCKNEILSSDKEVCQKITKQYEEYKNQDKIAIRFNKRLKEFCEFDKKDKFIQRRDYTFKDGSNMPNWFLQNREKIAQSDNLYAKEAMIQYMNFKLRKNDRFEEFLKEEDMNKFRSTKVLFEDGTSMYNWFCINKVFIFMSDNEICKKIVDQFNIYYEYTSNLLSNKKIEELIKIPDLQKFYQKSEVRFKDGTLTGRWFYNHKEQALMLSDEILKQYEEYIIKRPDSVYKDRQYEEFQNIKFKKEQK